MQLHAMRDSMMRRDDIALGAARRGPESILPAGPVRALTATSTTVSLALGSGGARGLAHIGVIQWLVEHGFLIRAIAGCSMGALVGGIYATSKLEIYAEWVSALERAHVVRLLDPVFDRGLFKGERLMSALRELIGDCAIEELPVPFTAVATDLASGEEVWLRHGRLFDAIRASIATPLIFTPFQHGARTLVDGALVNPIPIAPMLDQRTDLTIAVDLCGPAESRSTRTHAALREDGAGGVRGFIEAQLGRASDVSARWITEFAVASMEAMHEAIASPRLATTRSPDITVEIPRDACALHEFWRAEELIALGRERAAQAFAARAPALSEVPAAAIGTEPVEASARLAQDSTGLS
jgi:NTE family protein